MASHLNFSPLRSSLSWHWDLYVSSKCKCQEVPMPCPTLPPKKYLCPSRMPFAGVRMGALDSQLHAIRVLTLQILLTPPPPQTWYPCKAMFLTGNQFSGTKRAALRAASRFLACSSQKKVIFANWELFVLHWLKFFNSYGKSDRVGGSKFWKRTATTHRGLPEDYWTLLGSRSLEIP